MKTAVLIVEDEGEIRDLIALHLNREGLEVTAVASVEEARKSLAEKSFGLIVLDWMLPGASGVELAREMRGGSARDTSREDTAILMVTARAEAEDIVAGLEAGADDYLTKPFEPAVLIARVRALLRRVSKPAAPQTENGFQVIEAGGLKLYPESHEAKCFDTPVSLTPSEFKLLHALISNRGRVLTRDSLIGFVQGEGVAVVGRTVDTHVFGLRKKLGECADVIETVRGVGYRVKPSTES